MGRVMHHLPKFLRDAIVDRLTGEKIADKRTIDDLANRYHAAARDLDVARRRVARDVARIEALATEVELLDATLAKADTEHDERADRIGELEAWVRDALVFINGQRWSGLAAHLRITAPLVEDSSPAGASSNGFSVDLRSKEDAQRNAAVDETAARAGASSPHGIEVAPNPAPSCSYCHWPIRDCTCDELDPGGVL
jgi:hypothetical protein